MLDFGSDSKGRWRPSATMNGFFRTTNVLMTALILFIGANTSLAASKVILASYPLTTDLADSTANFGNVELAGNPVPPSPPTPGNPLCQNGVDLYTVGSQEIRTPYIASLDPTDFQIDVDFNATSFLSSDTRGHPVIMAGTGYRWIGIYLDGNGVVGIKHNNFKHINSSTTLSTATWYSAQIRYENGQVQLLVDGIVVLSENIGALDHGNDFSLVTNDYSSSLALHGCIRNLVIANDTTLEGPPAVGTVVEFYNSDLDHYFLTANASEAAAIDSGSAGPGWSRTGNDFKAGGNTPVCRFYGSQTPGPNSHFYTADAGECALLQQLQATTPVTQKRWNYESLDFLTTVPVNGACPNGTRPVYRAYNNGSARNVDSNHRITSNPAAIQEVVTRGWIAEGLVMCAPV